jgi:hypothetical protein
MAAKKPPGWNAFNQLARKVAQVPKEAADAKMAADKKARKKAKKKKR